MSCVVRMCSAISSELDMAGHQLIALDSKPRFMLSVCLKLNNKGERKQECRREGKEDQLYASFRKQV